ncbi:hypothetical protein HPB47_022148 [Ixodes persulcatus]|uniref:Uncharacterized protein n=1 Tax=Ixodes persulcatus TaxID=34615 RepID=A0AC60QAI1_IXOPE|nr:hypothetical protein HPB47_022148 [Ixodes persulcatus]
MAADVTSQSQDDSDDQLPPRKKPRSKWTSEWLARVHQQGAYENLMRELALEDSEAYRRWIRMDTGSFEDLLARCTAVCEENLEEMGGNAALANEFELPFSDLTPTERQMAVRTQNSGLALYEGAIDLPPAPRSPPQSDSG